MLSKSIIEIAKNSKDIFRLGGRTELKIFNKYQDFCKYIARNHHSEDKYHSISHLYGTSLIAQQLCFENLICADRMERICIAAFLHDYCYQKHIDDDISVNFTMKRLCNEYEEIKKTFKNLLNIFDLFSFAEILRFIKYTTFTEQWEKTTVPEIAFKILRDADQLYSLVFICDELYDVLYEDFSFGSSHIDFIKRQLKRVEDIQFLTDEANELFKIIKPQVIDFYQNKLNLAGG